MKKLALLLVLTASPAFAFDLMMKVALHRNGVGASCYITNARLDKVCRDDAAWKPEYQQLFDTFTLDQEYTTTVGLKRSLRQDLRDGYGLGPWVRGYVLPEYRRRGVRF